MRVDAIYENGRFWTGDPTHPEANSVAVLHGRVVAVDEVDGVQARRTVDLGGKRIIPGLHDAHHHLGLTGIRLMNLDVRPRIVASLDALYDAIAAHARSLPDDAWVRASGYDQNFLGGQHPTAEGLDRAAGGRPVLLEHISGHMVVANTRAFELGGYPGRRDYPDIDGGRVFRDDGGLATGLLQEAAMGPLEEAASIRDEATVSEVLRRASDHAVAYGLTSITEPGVTVDGSMGPGGMEIHHYLTAIADGRIRPRMTVMPIHSALHPLDRAPDGVKSLDWGIRTGLGNDQLRIGPVKIFSDGSLIGRSAAVHDCYCGEPDNFGVLRLTPEELHEALISYHRAGWTVAMHAIGDRAIDHVLNAVEEAQREMPRTVRHRIEHFAIASDEHVRRCAALGVIPVPQGVFISDFGDGMLSAIGDARARGTYRMRSLLDAGMIVPGSTDSPISDANPMVSIHDLVNRVTSGGKLFGADERVSVEEALTAYTYGSAYAVEAENERGRIAPGQLADFVALSHDILAADPTGIREITATATIIGGEVAYEAA